MNAWVPLVAAAQAARRPVRTVRTWAANGDVRSTRTDDGRVLVWWPDVYDRTFTAPRRLRHTA